MQKDGSVLWRRRRQPVSLLVRTVLEGALDLVEDIVETSLGGVRAGRRSEMAPDDVYGWQELVLMTTQIFAGARALCRIRRYPRRVGTVSLTVRNLSGGHVPFAR